MATTTKATERTVTAEDQPEGGLTADHTRLTLEFSLNEADALRSWLLKSVLDGATALDDALVSAALGTISQAVDAAHATSNIRCELEAAGLDVKHLTDEQVRELGRRVSDAAIPAIRA